MMRQLMTDIKMVYLKDLTSLNLAFISHSTLKAKSLESSLCTAKAYKTTNPDHADVLIVLGGDGFMLKNLHLYQKQISLFMV